MGPNHARAGDYRGSARISWMIADKSIGRGGAVYCRDMMELSQNGFSRHLEIYRDD